MTEPGWSEERDGTMRIRAVPGGVEVTLDDTRTILDPDMAVRIAGAILQAVGVDVWAAPPALTSPRRSATLRGTRPNPTGGPG